MNVLRKGSNNWQLLRRTEKITTQISKRDFMSDYEDLEIYALEEIEEAELNDNIKRRVQVINKVFNK